jgi:chromosome segregation ATPase
MIDTDPTLKELQKQLTECDRQLRNATYYQHQREPDQFKIRRLESQKHTLNSRIARLKELTREVKDLESTLSMKMMNRYPENKPRRNEYKRELTRLTRQLNEFVEKYKPKETVHRPAWR